jgi:ankyrin repeat protein
MTALHWAAMQGDGAMAEMLLVAGANPRATTRIGGFTALHLASQAGRAEAVPAHQAGAPWMPRRPPAPPLMLAAAAGNADIVARSRRRRDLNHRDGARSEALMSPARRTEAPGAAGARRRCDAPRVVDLDGRSARRSAADQPASSRQPAAAARGGGARPASVRPRRRPRQPCRGRLRPYKRNELIGKHGGLTALHFAAEGASRRRARSRRGGADVNGQTAGDLTSPMLIAMVNGHFDLALLLLEKGANPNLASDAGMTPLYAALNVHWAPKAFYPQPRAYLQQRASYLDVMKALLAKGADPNARLQRKIWYTQYNFDLLRVDDSGATPFWRAAYASDIEAMKLLVAAGADPSVPTAKPAMNDRFQQGGVRSADASRDHSGLPAIPTAGPDIPPLLAASGAGYGEGFAGNAHRFAPSGMLAAVKYLIEDLGTDPNVRDADGNTAVHHAASRGDNEMIKYLVSKGADVTLVNRGGQTTVDMANGPVQRVQPFPETIKLLESLGAKNNHKCVSC